MIRNTHLFNLPPFNICLCELCDCIQVKAGGEGDKPLFALPLVYIAFIHATQRLVIFSRLLDIYL